jgi:hypothetical protein
MISFDITSNVDGVVGFKIKSDELYDSLKFIENVVRVIVSILFKFIYI